MLVTKIPIGAYFAYRNYCILSSAVCTPILWYKRQLLYQRKGVLTNFANRDTLHGITLFPPPAYDKKEDKKITSADTCVKPVQKQDKLKSDLKNWLQVYESSGGNVPENISEKHMNSLLQKYQISISEAMKYLRYLQYKEEKGKIGYWLWINSMVRRINKATMNSLQYGHPLIIDVGFDCHKTDSEEESLGRQLRLSTELNMRNEDPFNLHICNLSEDRLNLIKKHSYLLTNPLFPMTVTSKSYLELFPRDKLVYLTPDSRTTMEYYDHDSIYIMGGIVGITEKRPYTLAKAESEGIRTMKLPLNKYRKFKIRMPLRISYMMEVLLELKKSGDFKKAFHRISTK